MCRLANKMSKAAPNIEPTPAVSGYDKMLFAIIERQLKSSSKRRAYVPPEQIARALRANAGAPLSPIILDYLCNFLEGKIKAPAGRPSDARAPAIKQIRKLLIPSIYAENLASLREQKRSTRLKDWETIQQEDCCQGPLHERAARMTSRWYNYSVDWRTVLNIVSKAKK
jgi:hypothetical protein